MTKLERRPGVTILNGVEHPDATWRCACGNSIKFRAFRLPPGWCEMEIQIGGEDGIPRSQTKLLCPRCTQLMVTGQRGPLDPPEVRTLPPNVQPPANWPPWKR